MSTRRMEYSALVYKSWVGGQAVDKKVGQANSFANSQSVDFRKSPSQISVLPGTRRADNGVVTDLVQNEVMIADGTIYAIGSSGNIYRVSPIGVWSLFGNIGESGTFGINWRQDQDAIYITGQNSVSQIVTVSTTPTLQPGFYGTSQSTYDNTSNAGFNVNSNQNSGTLTTAIGTTYTETTSQERFFQTDITPVYSIGVKIASKGTGDWTLVVHDGLNNQIGTATITNANLTTGVFNEFVFSSPLQINVNAYNPASGTNSNNAQTYHFHVTSTVADGTVYSTATNDLSTCDMDLYANRLINTSTGIHPIVTFQQFECIGNGRYLSIWEPLGDIPTNTEWGREGLAFPPGYEVIGEAVFNEYLVIATKLTVTGSNTAQQGILFYWDGLSSTYNYFTRIPEGSPEGLHEYENAIYYVANGNWYTITSVAATPQKIRSLPGAENTYTGSNTPTTVNPYVGTVRNGIHLLGWPSTTSNTSIPYGVYSWGRVDYTQPNSFGYSYILSTGSQYKTNTNNLTIGMVRNYGSILHISWRDGSTYGVDVIDSTSTPASYSTWESLIVDNGIVTKQKQASYMEASWLSIQNGVQIVLKYSINRGAWQYSPKYSNANLWSVEGNPNYARLDFGNDDGTIQERYNELQIGIDVYCDSTVTNTPVIIGVSAPFSSLYEELLQ